MGANPPKPRYITPFDQKQKLVMTGLKAKIQSVPPESIGIKPETKTELHGHDLVLINQELGMGGYQYDMTTKHPMRVKIEHMGLKEYRVRYFVPGFLFEKCISEHKCYIDQLPAVLQAQWEIFKHR